MDYPPPLPSEVANAGHDRPVTRADLYNVQRVLQMGRGVAVLQIGLVLSAVFYSIATGLYLNYRSATGYGEKTVLLAGYIPMYLNGWMPLLGVVGWMCCFVGALRIAAGADGRREAKLALWSAIFMFSPAVPFVLGMIADVHPLAGIHLERAAAWCSLAMFVSPFLLARFIRRMARTFAMRGLEWPCRIWGHYALPVLILMQGFTILRPGMIFYMNMSWTGILTCALSVLMMLALIGILHHFRTSLYGLDIADLRIH